MISTIIAYTLGLCIFCSAFYVACRVYAVYYAAKDENEAPIPEVMPVTTRRKAVKKTPTKAQAKKTPPKKVPGKKVATKQPVKKIAKQKSKNA